jgi:hypothetical protein
MIGTAMEEADALVKKDPEGKDPKKLVRQKRLLCTISYHK